MKLKLKLLAAAMAVVATAPVFASTIANTLSGDGGLFLSAWDPTANAGAGTSYTLNLGMTESTFNGNGTFTFLPDANMTSFLGQVTPGNILWNVVAGDSTGGIAAGALNYFVTGLATPTTAQTPSNSQLNNASAIDTYINAANNDLASSNSVTHASLGATDAEYAGSGAFGPSLGGKISYNTTGHLGDNLIFQEFSSSSSSSLAKGIVSPFAGNWQLGTDGTLSYTAQVVPVPAAAWLFGSGIVGLVGVARRKHATA